MDAPIEKKETIFDVVKRERLPLFIEDDSLKGADEIADEVNSADNTIGSMEQFVTSQLEGQLNPSRSSTFRKVCALLKKSGYWPDVDCSFDAGTLNDLNLLKGNYDSPTQNLVEKIKTKTEVGHVTLCAQLLHPLTNCADLEKRQESIKRLRERIDEINTVLERSKHSENAYLAFWQLTGEDDFFNFALKEDQLKIPYAHKSEMIASLQNAWNRSESCVLVQEVAPHVIQSVSLMMNGIKNFFRWNRGEINSIQEVAQMFDHMGIAVAPPFTTPEGVLYRLSLLAPGKLAQFLGYGASAVYHGRSALNTNPLEEMKARLVSIRCMQKKLIELNKFFQATRAIQENLEKTADPALQELARKLHLERSIKVQELLTSLNSSTFQGQESCWSHLGRIKTTYVLANESKKDLLPVYAALGEIDFLNSAACLHASSNNAFCFPYFVSADEPGIAIRQYWNIMRDSHMAVKNNLQMGKILQHSGKNACRSIMISGSNGTGKTENTDALMKAAIMAQTICVSPAFFLFITPFTKFITQIKTETNASRDRSLLMSVAERMGTILKTIDQSDGFTFVELDEPCGGATKEKLARSAAYALIRRIGHHPRTLSLTTTHFLHPTELEKQYPTIFANYRTTDDYHIEPGIHLQSFESEEEGLKIFARFAGNNFANEVENDVGDCERRIAGGSGKNK
ncbi:MAG: hypothetical protein AMXMBFR12_07280 [Candidatus Babeliales bacterium]